MRAAADRRRRDVQPDRQAGTEGGLQLQGLTRNNLIIIMIISQLK